MKASLIYITHENAEKATSLGKKLVQEKLAACVNIIPSMQSIYHWKGSVESATETVLIAKTRESLVHQLIQRVKTLHSYECPCIISLPIQGGNENFLEWIYSETRGNSSGN